MKERLIKLLINNVWTRYMPESTYNIYEKLVDMSQSSEKLDQKTELEKVRIAKLEKNNIIENEKNKALTNIGETYPITLEDNINLLLKFKLIEKIDESGDMYRILEEINKPEEVLNLPEEEKKTIENIKFEIKYGEKINLLFSMLISNNYRLNCSVDHILNITKIKIADLRTILEYLLDVEGSISISGEKNISKIKKQSKIRIVVIKDVFEEKRFIL